MRPVATIAAIPASVTRPTARTVAGENSRLSARIVRSRSIATARTEAGSRPGGSAAHPRLLDDVGGHRVDVVAADQALRHAGAAVDDRPAHLLDGRADRRPGSRRWCWARACPPRASDTRRSSAPRDNAGPDPRRSAAAARRGQGERRGQDGNGGGAHLPSVSFDRDGRRRQTPVRPHPERVPGRRAAVRGHRRAARDGRGRGDRARAAPARRADHPPGLGDLRHAQARISLDARRRPRPGRAGRRGGRGRSRRTPA